MKTLQEIILESVPVKDKKREAAYALSPNADRQRCPQSLKSSRHSQEYIRGYFGNTPEEVLYSVEIMLSRMGVDLNDIELEFGMFKKYASDKYSGVKVTNISDHDIVIKQYSFLLDRNEPKYIVNTNSELRDKLLTPNNLGLTKYTFSSKEDMINKVKKGLKQCNLDDYTDILVGLCDCINSSEKCSFDKLINNTIVYTCNKSVIGNLTEKNFNTISKDFGEILGPLAFMDKLPGDVKISYPSASNAKMFDYIINDSINISAKYDDGATPSAVDLMKQIQQKGKIQKKEQLDQADLDQIQYVYSSGIIDVENADEREFLEVIVPIIADNSRKKGDSSIRRQTWKLALYAEATDHKIKSALDVLRKYGIELTEKGIPNDVIDHLYSNGDLKSLLTEFYKAADYNASKTPIDSIIRDYDNIIHANTGFREGIILYPIKKIVVQHLNTKYIKYLTKYANIVLDGYQLYLTHKIIGNNIELRFELKQMNKHDFKFEQTGSVNHPFLKSWGLRMNKN